SPVQGTPQGLAVYMQGIRVNEAFGDTVNWDLIPKVAIGRSDIWTNNPTFGLNALGGAISFQMKDGFTYNGTEFDASGGSYGRVGGSLQYGVRNGEWGLYLAAEGLKDDGWRLQSDIAAGALLRRSRLEGHRCRDSSRHVRSRQFLRRGRTDADRTARERLSRHLHLAPDHEERSGAGRAQWPLLRDRPLDGPEQSLLSPV